MSETIEDIILQQDKRGVSALRPHLPADYCSRAASYIMDHPGDAVIVTGYYAHYFKDHQGTNENHDVVSHCLRWSPPADWPPVA